MFKSTFRLAFLLVLLLALKTAAAQDANEAIENMLAYREKQTRSIIKYITEAAATGAWHLRREPWGTLANRGSGNGCLAPEGNHGER